ncbi:MAG: NAD(P)(+) transhydrogenase (Re/Si-specific) subunit beta [Acidobacteriota bacterium]|nr:NAD(P)(+) transhydrogenase (Re/Si-specific) subunit beta [Blastocatellia bacterium]MDW8411164.1 NAD(P)(+) transhydrogenase (Re/Si-specific) subunit beta [Acidobacteriota bacterium]
MEKLINVAYLVASVLFILGIKQLGSPRTARNGNFLSSLGMLIAILVTLFDKHVLSFQWILVGMLVGGAIGAVMALKVEMTAMPQMVGLLNGFGGGASALVALSEYYRSGFNTQLETIISIMLSLIIGSVTFSGSLIAFGKLQGLVTGNSVQYPGQHVINLLLILLTVTLSLLVVLQQSLQWAVITVVGLGLLLGVLLVIPIGGADMPVVISLLNSYSGVAAATTGFVLRNPMLIITGALVGASGVILTNIMCRGMNRSLMNVLLGGWATAAQLEAARGKKEIVIKSVDAEEAAMLFESARSVIIVPGYGMAVAQAQHAVRDLKNVLEQKGIDVKFAIHPVAGRMPGHMNILLAESQIEYEKMYALEDINDAFHQTDIAFVVGANDVVNPAARNNPSSPIYGMPILNVDYAKTVIINKRSMAAGYAGIDNELFGYPNALMYFGDAREAITRLVNELKNHS